MTFPRFYGTARILHIQKCSCPSQCAVRVGGGDRSCTCSILCIKQHTSQWNNENHRQRNDITLKEWLWSSIQQPPQPFTHLSLICRGDWPAKFSWDKRSSATVSTFFLSVDSIFCSLIILDTSFCEGVPSTIKTRMLEQQNKIIHCTDAAK